MSDTSVPVSAWHERRSIADQGSFSPKFHDGFPRAAISWEQEFKSMVLGLSTAIGQIAYSISPALLGLVRDLSGGYRPALAVCIGLQIPAALLILRQPTGRSFSQSLK